MYVCYNLGLLFSELVVPKTSAFTELASETSYILGYENMTLNIHIEKSETIWMTLNDVAFISEYLISVISCNVLKNIGVIWKIDTNILSYDGRLICKL